MTAGTSRHRTIVASTATAVASPTPKIFTVESVLRMKLLNTTIMINAAAVTMWPVSARPRRTDTVMSPVRSHCSLMPVRRNTS